MAETLVPTIKITVSQPHLHIDGTVDGYPTQTAIITFGHWFKGDKGDDGESAYQVWLDEGHTGTEEDFLEWLKADSVQSDWNENDSTAESFIRNKPTIPTVNDATLTIQKNGTNVGTFTANSSQDKIINIRVPSTAADVNALPASTDYGASLSLTMNSSTYVLTARLKDQNGNNLGSAQTIDLPLESVVVSGSYDSTNKKIVLTLQNGNTIDVPVGDLINGLQSEITAQNPLSADFVTDGNTNKVYTETEKTKLAGIQAGAEVNVQSDWNQSNSSADDYIKNKPTIPSAINDLSDVDITSATNQNVLMYDSASSKWKNAVIPQGVTSLSALSDVDLDSLANGQMLQYNSTSQKWENQDIPSDAFICTLTSTTVDDTTTYSCDKTIAEIKAADNAGKVVLMKYYNFILPLTLAESSAASFSAFFASGLGAGIGIAYGTNDGVNDSWTFGSSGISNVAFSGDYSDLSNTPTLGTAAALDVAASGNASSTQVVKGDDTRLTDSRPASDVSAWAKESTKPSYTASEVGAVPTTQKGANGGVAELDSNGKVPSSQLPSYVDDVLEYASQSAFPTTGESGKIYIALDTNKTYRWSGSAYVEISESIALGETSSTAYAGNKGKANADAIAAIKDGTSIDSFGDVETALADKINKSSTAGLVKNDGTIDTNTYLTQHQDISGKADKVSNATNDNFAALDSNGNLKDSGSKASDFQTTIDASHKLSADYIQDGTTNKVINVKPDWNAAAGTAAEILNKPIIPPTVSGTNDGTNWTSLTIGSTTKNIPSGGGGGSSTLAGLTDVDVSNPSDGQVLTYDNANSEWKNTTQYAAVLRTWTNS